MNDFVDNKTKPNVRTGGQSSRMSQLLRASLANVSDRPPPRDVVFNQFSHRHPLLRLHFRESEGIKCSFCNISSLVGLMPPRSIVIITLGHGRAYYCTQCKFIINCHCASAPKTLTLEDNVSYELFFSFPFKHGKAEINCNICSDVVVIKDGLFYYNRERHEALHVIYALDEEAGFDNDKMDMLSIQRLQELRII